MEFNLKALEPEAKEIKKQYGTTLREMSERTGMLPIEPKPGKRLYVYKIGYGNHLVVSLMKPDQMRLEEINGDNYIGSIAILDE